MSNRVLFFLVVDYFVGGTYAKKGIKSRVHARGSSRSTNVARSQLVFERAVAFCIPCPEIRRSRVRKVPPDIDFSASRTQSIIRGSPT